MVLAFAKPACTVLPFGVGDVSRWAAGGWRPLCLLEALLDGADNVLHEGSLVFTLEGMDGWLLGLGTSFLEASLDPSDGG